MSRGRLINKFSATFGMLDASLTMYDTDYHDLSMSSNRMETEVTLFCQVEEPTWYRATYKYHGVEQDGEMTLILHYADIELLGLLSSDGKCMIGIGTRLISLAQESGAVVSTYPNPPGMYVIQAKDSSFGLDMDQNPTRNLLILLLAPRPQAV